MWLRDAYRKPEGPTAVVAFLGDTLFGYPPGVRVEVDPSLPRLLAECDHVVVNQEGPLTTAPPSFHSGAVLASAPAAASDLAALGVSVATLANNHMLDHGREGLEETLCLLAENGIKTVGAGRTRAEAQAPCLLDLPSGPMAIVACTDHCRTRSPAEEALVACPVDVGALKRRIGRLREQGHLVCVQYHGGQEFFRVPWPRRRRILQTLSRAGAQIVIAHHAHVFQGMQADKDRIIAYGLGNFYLNTTGCAKRKGTGTGLVLAVEIDASGPYAVRHLFVRTDIDRPAVRLLTGREKESVESIFRGLGSTMHCHREYQRAHRYECFMRLAGNHSTKPPRIKGWLGRVARFGLNACSHLVRAPSDVVARHVLGSALLAVPGFLTGFGRRVDWFPEGWKEQRNR